MDDTFELLSKMYGELTEFRKETHTRFDNVEGRLGTVEGRLDNVEGSMKTLGNQVTSLEHDLKRDIAALYDGYKQTYEKLEIIDAKVDVLTEKVGKHDIRIQVIEGGRK